MEVIEFKSRFTDKPKEPHEFPIDAHLSEKIKNWKKLPEDVKHKAEILGYKKVIWDNYKDPPLLSSHKWEDLSSQQVDAAILFGYSKKDF